MPYRINSSKVQKDYRRVYVAQYKKWWLFGRWADIGDPTLVKYQARKDIDLHRHLSQNK